MFGYLAPLKSELKMREFEVYNAYYCSVCHAVKRRYGELPRLMLSYDSVLLAMLAEGFIGERKGPAFKVFRCFNNPAKKRNEALPSEGIDYAADVMVLLGWLGLADRKHDRDDTNPLKYVATTAGEALIRRAGEKAAEKLGEKARVCRECVEEQRKLEASGEGSLDKASDPTGRMMAEVMDMAPAAAGGGKDERNSVSFVLREMGYHLGRYIYIIDAADDLEKDRKSGAYNPLLIHPVPPETLETAVSLDLARVCELAYKLKLIDHKSIIDNIFYLGLRAKMDEVLAKISERGNENV